MTWSKLDIGPVGASLRSIVFTGPQTGYVAGDSGIILTTSDSGNSWGLSRPGGNTRLNSVFFVNAHLGYVVGDSGMVLQATIPYGAGWQEDRQDQNDLALFPNPASGQVTLRYNLAGSTDMKVVIYSLTGETRYTGKFHRDKQFNLDISGLPDGLYILRATSGSLVFCKKLMVWSR
jgi:hypothetical protein